MKVSATSQIQAGAGQVWDTVKHFGGVTRWAPGITDCTTTGNGIGALRTIKTNGMTIVERLETYDENARKFSYSIVEGPLPVKNYLGEVNVSGNDGTCTVEWTTSAEAVGIPDEQLEKILGGVCRGSVKALKTHCELQATSQMAKIRPEDLQQ